MSQSPDQPRRAEIPALEWIIGACGLVIVALAVGILLYEGIAGDDSPPDIQLTVESIAPARDGFLVKVRAENRGEQPAANVAIRAELQQDGKTLEEAGAEFDFLAPGSRRDAGVYFRQDPARGQLRLLTRGYIKP